MVTNAHSLARLLLHSGQHWPGTGFAQLTAGHVTFSQITWPRVHVQSWQLSIHTSPSVRLTSPITHDLLYRPPRNRPCMISLSSLISLSCWSFCVCVVTEKCGFTDRCNNAVYPMMSKRDLYLLYSTAVGSYFHKRQFGFSCDKIRRTSGTTC